MRETKVGGQQGFGWWFLKVWFQIQTQDNIERFVEGQADRQGLPAKTTQLEALGIRKRQTNKDCPQAVLPGPHQT